LSSTAGYLRKDKTGIEAKERRGRRCGNIPNDLKKRRGYVI
jgi:hypothetical protein